MRDKNAWLFVLAFVIISVIGLTCVSFTNASADNLPRNGIRSSTSYSCRGIAYGVLVTVLHDGHLFIVEGESQKGSILHHPDCTCFTRKVEK